MINNFYKTCLFIFLILNNRKLVRASNDVRVSELQKMII